MSINLSDYYVIRQKRERKREREVFFRTQARNTQSGKHVQNFSEAGHKKRE